MKLINFATSFFRKTILLLILLNTACFGNTVLSDQNETFNKKYAKDIEGIKSARVEPEIIKSDAKLNFAAPVDQDQSRYTNNNVVIPEFYSSQQFANQSPSSPDFTAPSELFENSYNPTITSPFRKIGAEFDVIAVPNQDAYGIKSTMSEKEYLLVSRKLLQKDIDKINSTKGADDVENSEILISEQKKLKRKAKMIKIFGQESVAVEDDFKDSESTKYGDYSDKAKKSSARKNNKKVEVVADKKVDSAKAVTPIQPVQVQVTQVPTSAQIPAVQVPANQVQAIPSQAAPIQPTPTN